MKFYKLSTDELTAELNTDLKSGLSQLEAQERLKKDGPNFRVYNKNTHTKIRIFRILAFLALIFLIYLATALFKKNLSFIFYGMTSVVLPAVFSVFCFAFVENIMRKSSRISPFDYGKLEVVRDGKTVSLSYRNITYGDIVLLKKGDYIPFDARIIESNGLVTDETDITSEDSVRKRPDNINDGNVDISRQYNMVFCSSYVVSGNARVVVTDISRRVYVCRKGRGSGKKVRHAVKISDFSKILSLLLLALSVVFSFISALILSDYISFAVSVILLTAALTSDFLSVYIDAVFGKCNHKLSEQGIFLKNQSVIDRLNLSDTLIIKHNMLFENNSEISGFVTENGEYRHLSEINKSNFSVFLYSSFCNDGADENSPYYSFKKLTVKILKGVGIDYSDIRTMCPVISRYSDAGSDYDLCGIVYDGSNVLIARGDYTGILRLCENSGCHTEAIEKLSRVSTEIVAVAVKQVDIIRDDLSAETDGFKLVGFIGLKREVSKEKLKKLKSLSKCGIHSTVLFSGNETLARSFYVRPKASFVSYNTILHETGNSDISKYDVIYDYDGKAEDVSDICADNRHLPIYFGNKSNENKKTVAFKACSSDMYSSKNNDVVSNGGLDAVYKAVLNAKSAFGAVRDLLYNEIFFVIVYIVCGILFCLLNRQTLFSPQILGFIVFGGIPLTALFSSYSLRRLELNSTGAFSFEPLQKKSLTFCAFSAVLFILMTVILYFVIPPQAASGYIAVALLSFFMPTVFEIDFNGKINVLEYLAGFIPAAAAAVIFVLPVADMFYVSSFSAVCAVSALISGILIRYLGSFISRSVKF